jgi:TIR domain
LATEAQTAFFSYSRDDSEFALRLAEDLKAAGASVWLDQLDIAPGQRWARAVQDALNSCHRLLVILSPSSVNSTNVEDEVAFALEEHKTVIPVLYRDCQVPFQLRPFQYVDFRTDYNRGFKALLKTLGVEQQPVAEPKTQVKFTVEITWPITEKDKAVIADIVAQLRKVSEDASLTLSEVREGSVVMHSTRAGFERLQESYGRGELKTISGFGLKELKIADKPDSLFARLIRMLANIRYVLALLIALGLVLGITFIWKASPELHVTQIPPAGEGGSGLIAPIAGTAKGVDFGGHKIVVYAFAGGVWWAQPSVDAPLTRIEEDGGWMTTTHLGSTYKVFLVDDSYRVFHQATNIPNAGPGIVASVTVKGKQE